MSQAGYPRVIQRSVTTGTGPFQLLPSREVTFSLFRDRLADGDPVVAMIMNPGKQEFQECLCTFHQGSPDTLTVLKVISSSGIADAAVAFTAGSKLVMLCEPSYSLRAAERLRPAIRCAVLDNHVLASVTAGGTLDGLTLVAGDRVGLFGQTTATQIGIYVVTSTTPVRSTDCWAGDTVSGAIVPILAGSFAGSQAICVNEAGDDIVGTSSLDWGIVVTQAQLDDLQASDIGNDSSVAGTTVKDALETLESEIGGAGNVTTTLPTTVDSVPSWDDTAGALRPSSNVQIHHSASDKLTFWASGGRILTVADAATINFDCNLSDQFLTTLGGDRTFTFTNVTTGQVIKILYYQDATGDRTPTWWNNISWDKGLTPIIDPQAGGWNAVVLMCIGVDAYSVPVWLELSRSTSAPRNGFTTATDAATVTFDTRISPKQKVTLGGNRTLAVQSKGLYVGLPFQLKLIQDGTGSRTATWFGTINWVAGSVPTLTTTAGKGDWFGFICTDTATPKFDGFVIGQGLSP